MPRLGAHNVTMGRRFRELTALVLQVEGFPDATPRQEPRRPHDIFEEGYPLSDVLGIPNVVVHTRADAQPSWSTALDSVENAAQLDGSDFGVLVEIRKGRPGADAYAVMSLAGWAKLARLALAKEAAA